MATPLMWTLLRQSALCSAERNKHKRTNELQINIVSCKRLTTHLARSSSNCCCCCSCTRRSSFAADPSAPRHQRTISAAVTQRWHSGPPPHTCEIFTIPSLSLPCSSTPACLAAANSHYSHFRYILYTAPLYIDIGQPNDVMWAAKQNNGATTL